MSNLITHVRFVIPRNDGSEVQIVATAMQPIMNPTDVDVFVLHRPNAQSQWSLCKNRAPLGVNTREAHIHGGRAEVFSYVTPMELLAVKSLIGQPMGSEQTLTFDARPPMARASWLKLHGMAA